MEKIVDTHLGKTFNNERAHNNLYTRWVEDITGETLDEENEHTALVTNLKVYTKLINYKKFKKMCEDDGERDKFLESIKTK